MSGPIRLCVCRQSETGPGHSALPTLTITVPAAIATLTLTEVVSRRIGEELSQQQLVEAQTDARGILEVANEAHSIARDRGDSCNIAMTEVVPERG